MPSFRARVTARRLGSRWSDESLLALRFAGRWRNRLLFFSFNTPLRFTRVVKRKSNAFVVSPSLFLTSIISFLVSPIFLRVAPLGDFSRRRAQILLNHLQNEA